MNVTTFKPSGYNSVSPYFIVEDVEVFVNMLIHVFNSTVIRRFHRNDGSIQHMEIRIDDSVIMVSEATETYPANQFLIHVYVPDVYETYKKALSVGCTSIEEPIQKDDPDTRGMFEDVAGNIWAIGTQEA